MNRGERVWSIALAAILVLLIGIGTYRYLTAPLLVSPSLQTIAIQAPEAKDLLWPDFGQSAVATKEYGVLATHGESAPQPTASTAKLILAVAIMQKKPYSDSRGDTIIFSGDDVAIYQSYQAGNGTVAAVTDGLEWTQHQALQAVMLASANNVSDTLATWAFGSLAEYRTYAQDMVEKIGMINTTIGVDASGYNATTTSTAHDLALLAAEALSYQPLREIMALQSVSLPVAGTIANTNRLLGDGEIIGMKTGWIPESGGVFVLAGEQAIDAVSHDVVTVVMGAPGSTSQVAQDAAYELYQSAKENFTYQEVISEGQQVGNYHIPWLPQPVAILATKSVGVFVWSGGAPDVTLRAHSLLPGDSGEIGKAHAAYGQWSVDVPLIVADSPSQPSGWWRIMQI